MLVSRFQTVTVNFAASDVILKLDFSQKGLVFDGCIDVKTLSQTKNAIPNNMSDRVRKLRSYSMSLQTLTGTLTELVLMPLFFKYRM